MSTPTDRHASGATTGPEPIDRYLQVGLGCLALFAVSGRDLHLQLALQCYAVYARKLLCHPFTSLSNGR